MVKFIDVDPNLSDFSQDELRDAALAISTYTDDLQRHLNSLEQYQLHDMFGDKMLEYAARIENLRTMVTQLINASARKTSQTQVISN